MGLLKTGPDSSWKSLRLSMSLWVMLQQPHLARQTAAAAVQGALAKQAPSVLALCDWMTVIGYNATMQQAAEAAGSSNVGQQQQLTGALALWQGD
ncbi:hypothetical protein COO60DRAFT_973071 [Scenedesmus sp. NREL 46B-D3]|nr:hypothetical protein COO60DRAFT_973071 [Scenedesmus sp. NREL 46B-D3]